MSEYGQPNPQPTKPPQTFTAEHEFTPPSAWQSIPGAVRFAVWVWAVGVIVGVAGGVLFAVVYALSTGPNR